MTQGQGGGRPTKFKTGFIDKLVKFFDVEPFYKEVCESSKEYFADGKLKKETEKFRYIANRMPTLYRFARSIKVDYTTVWRWAEKGEAIDDKPSKELEKFCNAYKEAKELQKEFLVSLGLGGMTPPAAFIFTAKNVTDMRDKQELDLGITPETKKLLTKQGGIFKKAIKTGLRGRGHSKVDTGESDSNRD